MHLKLKKYLVHSYVNITFWVFFFFLLLFWLLPIIFHILTGSFTFSDIFTGVSSDFITAALGVSLIIVTLFNNTNFRFAISNGISRKSYWKTRMILLTAFVLITRIVSFIIKLIEEPYVFAGSGNFIPRVLTTEFSFFSYSNNSTLNFLMSFFLSLLVTLCSIYFFMAFNNFYLMFTKKMRRIIVFAIIALVIAVPFMIGMFFAYLEYMGGNALAVSMGKFILSIFGLNLVKDGMYFNPILFAFDMIIIDIFLAFLSYKFNSKIQVYKD
ncbi:hypothetical protein [Apilactobacillus xinyiensis]|uniref:hypothetical protein n=1 Tax=Apilactobacillus xinyiensis TaxID=2841032 RepID=UPI00200E9268|nr:hypothetical protein [Apilactobacillus xinyiensis]MCL0330038.1 hypothetical protein [Apilactobacillus xinyiensis]